MDNLRMYKRNNVISTADGDLDIYAISYRAL